MRITIPNHRKDHLLKWISILHFYPYDYFAIIWILSLLRTCCWMLCFEIFHSKSHFFLVFSLVNVIIEFIFFLNCKRYWLKLNLLHFLTTPIHLKEHDAQPFVSKDLGAGVKNYFEFLDFLFLSLQTPNIYQATSCIFSWDRQSRPHRLLIFHWQSVSSNSLLVPLLPEQNYK